MDPRHLFVDERHGGRCVYCGAQPDTRDHVPSKVLLDEPYPHELPVADACSSCNAAFSLDEQYLACMIECVMSGSAEPSSLQRTKIKRILHEVPTLQRRIKESQRKDSAGNLTWHAEVDRIRKIILKLARGHAAYELYPKIDEPDRVDFSPALALSDQERALFEGAESGGHGPWPEIGSRAFLRACGKTTDRFEEVGGWITVQPGRYRYSVVEGGGVLVRMVLSEYLACAVSWE